MLKSKQILLFLLILAITCPSLSLAAKSKATPTPMPQSISEEPVDPPEIIQKALDIAYEEWQNTAGKVMKAPNKYTKWYNNASNVGWCAHFVTWCLMEAGVSMDEEKVVLAKPEGEPATGVYHIKGSSPSKLVHSYTHMHRTSSIPQKGFIVLYAEDYNMWVHVGLVYDVEKLDNGKYRLTTIEGAMAGTIKMYIFDYDPDAEFSYKNKYPDNTNVSQVPEEERTGEVSKYRTYDLKVKDKNKKKPWYINCFLMPWIPGDDSL